MGFAKGLSINFNVQHQRRYDVGGECIISLYKNNVIERMR